MNLCVFCSPKFCSHNKANCADGKCFFAFKIPCATELEVASTEVCALLGHRGDLWGESQALSPTVLVPRPAEFLSK